MSAGPARFLRENAFLVAAVALPLVVVGLFLLATAIQRWGVPPPAYDLVLRASGPQDPANRGVAVEFAVRDGRVEAIVRRAPEGTYAYPAGLFIFDHETGGVRQIPFDVPEPPAEDGESLTVVVESLTSTRVLDQAQAPDGYQLQSRSRNDAGIVGALFGMSRYGRRLAIAKDGRAVPIELPAPYGYRYLPDATAVGWIADGQP